MVPVVVGPWLFANTQKTKSQSCFIEFRNKKVGLAHNGGYPEL